MVTKKLKKKKRKTEEKIERGNPKIHKYNLDQNSKEKKVEIV